MIYNNFLYDKKKFNQLSSFYKNNKIQNAYIFHGNEGIGKEAYAIEFFALINCINKLEDESACRTCSSCIKILSLQHELLNIILPFPRSKNITKKDSALKALSDKDLNSLTQQFRIKASNPYYKIRLENANTILINSIKDINKSISLSIPQGSYKLHLILNAEKLCFPNQESANALLKILEEPTENNFFILVTSDLSKILDTIISRCTTLYFDPLNFNKQYNYLLDKGITKESAEIITRLSTGSISYAIELSKNFEKKMESINKIISYLLHQDIYNWKTKLCSNRDKKITVEYLNFLTLFIRDVYVYQNKLNQATNFSNLNKLIEQFSEKYTINFEDCVTSINHTINNIYLNGYMPIMVTTLFIELHKILISKSEIKNIEYN